MTDRLDAIRKRLASGTPFTAHAGDLAWAVGEIERLTGDIAEVDMVLGIVGADREFRRVMLCANRDRMKGLVADVARLTTENASLRSQLDDGGLSAHQGFDDDQMRAADVVIARMIGDAAAEDDSALAYTRAEIARLDALSRATADAEAADETENQA